MTKITKAEFETLPESLKGKFTAQGEDYVLQEEDVDGLKKSKAEILEEKKRIQSERDELAKFKSEQEAKAQAEEQAKLEKKGEFDKLLEAKEKAFQERLATETAERERIQNNLRNAEWRTTLTKNGIRSEVLDAMDELKKIEARIELANTDTGFALKFKDGVGDANELTQAVTEWSEKYQFTKPSPNASGSGASPSNGTNGTRNLSDMSPTEKLDTLYSK
jgi:hypothetical protein